MPMPPPMQSVATPFFSCLSRSAYSRVTSTRAPGKPTEPNYRLSAAVSPSDELQEDINTAHTIRPERIANLVTWHKNIVTGSNSFVQRDTKYRSVIISNTEYIQ